MTLYRCLCGQPLAAFASEYGALGLAFSQQYVDRAVNDALHRHLTTAAADREHGLPDRLPIASVAAAL